MPQVVALRCPHCAAALKVEAGATSTTCAYCGTTSMLQRGGTVVAPPGAAPYTPKSAAPVVLGAVVTGLAVTMLAVFSLCRVSAPEPPHTVPRDTIVTAQPAALPDRVAVPAPEPPPARRVESIDTGRRPMLVDVDGDGPADVVALTRLSEGPRSWTAYVAFSSQTGAVLWTVDVADEDARSVHAAIAHGRLVLLTDRGQVSGHDLRTGASQWTTSLGERGTHLCASKAADALEIPTADERVLQLDVKTGRQAPVAAIPGCAALPTDLEPTNNDPTDRRDDRAPATTQAIRCGGVSMYTSAGFSKQPDQCRTKTKVDVEALPGLVAHSLWQTDMGWLVLGVRKPGTYVPTIGLVDAKSRKLTWKADVPDGNPLLADQGGPDPAILVGDRVIVGYTVKDQPPHLTAFALEGGARKWHIDVPGGKRISRTATADDRVFLYAGGSVHLLDPATGSTLRTIGPGSV